MDENISKTLSWFSMIVFILGAFTLFFIMYRDGLHTLRLVNHGIHGGKTVYQTDEPLIVADGEHQTDVKGSDIVALIRNGLETDILVDDVFFSHMANTHSVDYHRIDRFSWYSVEYQFDASGKITAVKYRKR